MTTHDTPSVCGSLGKHISFTFLIYIECQAFNNNADQRTMGSKSQYHSSVALSSIDNSPRTGLATPLISPNVDGVPPSLDPIIQCTLFQWYFCQLKVTHYHDHSLGDTPQWLMTECTLTLITNWLQAPGPNLDKLTSSWVWGYRRLSRGHSNHGVILIQSMWSNKPSIAGINELWHQDCTGLFILRVCGSGGHLTTDRGRRRQ